jgi:hypothetical protein
MGCGAVLEVALTAYSLETFLTPDQTPEGAFAWHFWTFAELQYFGFQSFRSQFQREKEARWITDATD